MSGAESGPVVGAGTWPAELEQDRAELLTLLLRDGILHRSESQPILSGDGKPARWMLDTLAVTLTPRGAELAARCLLGLLTEFEGRQLATYGLTGVPLLEGCILRGAGRYRGALVRKERKPHGSLKLIEGRLDPSEPVVVVDDSISSGYSMTECARRLESAGFEVEGGVCLVRFDFERGPARMLESGYRIGAVFDIWNDFICHMDGEAPYPLNPTKDSVEALASTRRAEEGLHPAVLARQAISEYLATGRRLRPPDRLDRNYDARGGCWVSLRRRADVYDRPARSGHWHFPGEVPNTAAADVVAAAVKTAAELAREVADPQRTVDECAIAVTFFSQLEGCTVGELDNDRFGIVVRSAVRSPRMGGALPRMPGIGNEWQQFRHAWRTNARLLPLEPYVVYRHGVEKVVEPGADWQPTGVPAPPPEARQSPSPGPALAVAALGAVLAELERDPAESDAPLPPVPPDVDAVFVTVFANGRVVGCVGGPPRPDTAWLSEYAVAATRDARFADPQPGDVLAVSVSLLANRFEIGEASPEWVVRPLRFAEQALEARQGDRRGLLLPFVAVTSDLTPTGYVEEVLRKAGITRPPYHWTRYDCTSWLADNGGVRRLAYGLPEGAPAGDGGEQLERMHGLLAGYARRHHSRSRPPLRRYDPFTDRLSEGLGAARLAYGAWVKARAGLRAEATDDASRLEDRLDGDGWVSMEGSQQPTTSELAFLLLALCTLDRAPATQQALAARLWAQVDGHGRFVVRRDGVDDDAYQDYAPGQALLALAAAVTAGATTVRADLLGRSMRHYRMRFRQNHSWGAVTWLLQAVAAWGELLRDQVLTAFAYEVADWALQFQSAKTGAFLNDHQSDSPGATTALYMEGLAALSVRSPDRTSATRYRSSCERALSFLDQLVYQERDAPVLTNPPQALGGLRRSLTSGTVYVDYVHHALAGVSTLRSATT